MVADTSQTTAKAKAEVEKKREGGRKQKLARLSNVFGVFVFNRQHDLFLTVVRKASANIT